VRRGQRESVWAQLVAGWQDIAPRVFVLATLLNTRHVPPRVPAIIFGQLADAIAQPFCSAALRRSASQVTSVTGPPADRALAR